MRFRIGEWTLEASEGTLTSETSSLRLEPRVLDVLRVLVERHGQVVSQDELLRAVWGDVHVAPVAVARTISILRASFGDDAYQPRYIETIPKRGYRLIAAVDRVPAPVIPARSNVMRYAAIGATAALLVIVSSTTTWRARPGDLAPLKAKPVPASYWEFAHETRVGNETAVTHYETQVARDPSSARDYEGLARAYLFRANYMADRERWTAAAIDTAKRASAIDRGPHALRVMAMAKAGEGRLSEAAAYYRQSLEAESPDVVTSVNLARVVLSQGRMAEALERYAGYLETAPMTVAAHTYVAQGLVFNGYPDEAMTLVNVALAHEPFARDAHMVALRIELLNGNYPAARARLGRLLEVYPDCVQCVTQLGLIAQQSGDLAEAEARYRASATTGAKLRLAQVLILTGRRPEALKLLDECDQSAHAAIARGSEQSMLRSNLAVSAGLRGDRRAAERWLDETVRAGRRDALWDSWDPLLESMQGTPAMAELRRLYQVEHDAAAPVVERIRALVNRHFAGVTR